jgi:hypothetical protein
VLIGGRRRLLAKQNPSMPVTAPVFFHQQPDGIPIGAWRGLAELFDALQEQPARRGPPPTAAPRPAARRVPPITWELA